MHDLTEISPTRLREPALSKTIDSPVTAIPRPERMSGTGLTSYKYLLHKCIYEIF